MIFNFAETVGVRELAKLDIPGWHWGALVGWFAFLLLLDLVVFHRKDHEPKIRESIIQTIVWVSLGVGLGFVFWAV